VRTQYYTASTLDGFIATEEDSLEWLFPLGALAGLVVSAQGRRWFWAWVTLQAMLLGLGVYATFADAGLYVGT
jgi:hypothetical protein